MVMLEKSLGQVTVTLIKYFTYELRHFLVEPVFFFFLVWKFRSEDRKASQTSKVFATHQIKIHRLRYPEFTLVNLTGLVIN